MNGFSITARFKSVSDNSVFCITTVYAPVQIELDSFFQKISNLAPASPEPWLVLGDFNMYKYPHEKSNSNVNWAMMDDFNSYIQNLGLTSI